MILTLKNVKINLSHHYDPSESDIVEWLEFQLGLNSSISNNNPLIDLDLKDIDITVGEANIDGKNIII